jgi:hypothetical protein
MALCTRNAPLPLQISETQAHRGHPQSEVRIVPSGSVDAGTQLADAARAAEIPADAASGAVISRDAEGGQGVRVASETRPAFGSVEEASPGVLWKEVKVYSTTSWSLRMSAGAPDYQFRR